MLGRTASSLYWMSRYVERAENMARLLEVGYRHQCPGRNLRCSWSPDLEAIRMADGGVGVLFIVLNHAGDVLSANVTMEMAKKQGLKVKMILTHEDISSGDRDHPEDRRGLVGFFPVYKVAGAASEAGATLDEVLAVSERLESNMRTLAVAVQTATHPSTGEAIFTLGDDEMEIGMGQHGEAGTGRMKLKSADETAEIMLSQLLDDLEAREGEELLVILNGAGATTLMELFIIFRREASFWRRERSKWRGVSSENISPRKNKPAFKCISPAWTANS